ncbi:MAG: hypothetical protein AB3N13_04790 [Arenibacterium sp.]
MRDDRDRWDRPGDLAFTGSFELREVEDTKQYLVSGVSVQRQFASDLVSWPDVAEAESYTLSLRRDQVLVVNAPVVAFGYDAEKGIAVTDMSSGYRLLELSGRDAWAQLKRGAELRLDMPSRSVMRRVFGIDVVLYRFANEGCFRLHVPRAMVPAFRKHLAEEA